MLAGSKLFRYDVLNTLFEQLFVTLTVMQAVAGLLLVKVYESYRQGVMLEYPGNDLGTAQLLMMLLRVTRPICVGSPAAIDPLNIWVEPMHGVGVIVGVG